MQVGKKLFVFLAILLSLLSSPVLSDWRCQVEDRCREYKNCVLDGRVSQCSYAASNATSGSLSFENGSAFFIEWTQDLEGEEQRILKLEGLAMVSNVLTKFWNTEPDCIEFEETDQNPSFGYGECAVGRLTNLFECNLPPYNFDVLRKGDQDDKDWVVIKQGKYSQEHAQATFMTDGSGVCRKAIWSFDNKGPMSISTLGCYGEVVPPESAVGEIIIDRGTFKSGFYCY